MANVIAELEHEHREIQKVITLMSNISREMGRGNNCEPTLLDEIVQFMRIFGEQCHHGKEEKALFSLLETKGVPANGCPIAALVGEHRHGHALLNQLEAASARYKVGDRSVRPALIKLFAIARRPLYATHLERGISAVPNGTQGARSRGLRELIETVRSP